MKTKISKSSGFAIRLDSVAAVLLLAGAMFFSPGWGVQRCAAGSGFPTTATDGSTFSIGVFQIVVDPNFAFLFAPAPSYSSYYPGYAGPASGILTGPVMFDGNTMIGESAKQVVGSEVFPAAAGTPGQYPANTTYSNIFGYSDYALIPSQFVTVPNGGVVPAGVEEIFTEIEQMDLQGYEDTNGQSCFDPRVPQMNSKGSTGLGGGVLTSVTAGPGAMGIGDTLPMNLRSIGMVQQITNGASSDFPAQSFFDIYVNVTLPPIPGTIANNDFPTNGAVLYNDASDPLLVENFSVTNLPPQVTYVHSNSTAVPIRFKYNNPPYWAAGDVLGYLTLAGHGVFTNTVTAMAPCVAATTGGGLLDQVLGPVGSPVAPPPVPWLRPTNSFPTPNSSYDSVENTVVNNGVTNVLDDTVSFPLGSQTVILRDLSLGSLGSSASLPTAGNSQAYTSSSTTVNFQISQNGVDFYPASLTGSSTIEVYNTNGVSGTYTMELTQLSAAGSWAGGTLYLQANPTKLSSGQHTIHSDPRGYRVSSFFDVFTELSTNGTDWIPTTRSMRVLASMPPAVPGSLFASQAGNKVVVQWQNSQDNFTLQSTRDLTVPFTDVPGPVTSGAYTNSLGNSQMFFRLRQ